MNKKYIAFALVGLVVLYVVTKKSKSTGLSGSPLIGEGGSNFDASKQDAALNIVKQVETQFA